MYSVDHREKKFKIQGEIMAGKPTCTCSLQMIDKQVKFFRGKNLKKYNNRSTVSNQIAVLILNSFWASDDDCSKD